MEVLNKNKYKLVNNRKDVVALREYITNSFKDLEFKEDTHEYFLKNKKLESVSNVCKRFKEPFDKKEKAQGCFEKYFDNPSSEYYQMTTQQILEQWNRISETACCFGTKKHTFGEDIFYLVTEQYDKIERNLVDGNLIPEDEEENNVIKFWNDLPDNYIPILSECKGYLEDKGVAGTFDNLFAIDGNGKLSQNLILTDYKTNKNLFNQFQDEMLLYPFEDLPADNFHLYNIQLSLYALCLNKVKCKVIGRRLIYLRGDNYSIYKLKDFTKKLEEYL
jgi:hypothetical protein